SSRRRHTRSLRDWSSDVCSSDLLLARLRHSTTGNLRRHHPHPNPPPSRGRAFALLPIALPLDGGGLGGGVSPRRKPRHEVASGRSEERRVGKECRSWWMREREKK